MKRAFTIFLAAVLAAGFCCLSGCARYVSKYFAVAFVHSNESDNAYMSFYTFKGTMVFKLKCKDAGQRIRYSAKLESGSAAVYTDCGDGKTELLSVGAGDETASVGGQIGKGTVYVIVETDGECTNGDFRFELE